jgi:hypothetical protein
MYFFRPRRLIPAVVMEGAEGSFDLAPAGPGDSAVAEEAAAAADHGHAHRSNVPPPRSEQVEEPAGTPSRSASSHCLLLLRQVSSLVSSSLLKNGPKSSQLRCNFSAQLAQPSEITALYRIVPARRVGLIFPVLPVPRTLPVDDGRAYTRQVWSPTGLTRFGIT